MAMHCNECGGTIPDVMIDISKDRNDCANHTKPEINLKLNRFLQG